MCELGSVPPSAAVTELVSHGDGIAVRRSGFRGRIHRQLTWTAEASLTTFVIIVMNI